MRVGVPKEIKNREHRVALRPDGAAHLVQNGHEVIVESAAGRDSGFSDQLYLDAGATIGSAADAWSAELVVKVKEPLAVEYAYFRDDLILFTYLHLAAVPELAVELQRSGVLALAYETVRLDDGGLPLLAPMSRVAGRMAAQLAVQYLQRENGSDVAGSGRLVCAMGDQPAAKALVLGGGNVGVEAALALAGLGADVTLLEAFEPRIMQLRDMSQLNATIMHYSQDTLAARLPDCDILIGAALIPGEHAPMLLSSADIGGMKAGSVFMDVAIDQGGMSQTSRATSFDAPLYCEQGVLHCCLPNLPAAVPQSSTAALTAATLPYISMITNRGVERAIAEDASLAAGVNVRDGRIVHQGVAHALADKL